MARGKNKKPRPERKAKQKALTARQEYEFQVLDDVACPGSTADRVQSLVDDGIDLSIDGLTFLNTADHVWRDRPEYAELHAIIISAREELVRRMEHLVQLYDRLSKLPEIEADHVDLTPDEVIARIEKYRVPDDLMDGGGGDP